MKTRYYFLGCKIDLYIHDYNLAIEVNEFDHCDRNNNDDKKREEKEEELDCKFIRIDPNEECFNKFKGIKEINRHIKKSSKKSLIDKILKILSRLKLKSNHSITKALNYVVKKYYNHYKTCKVIV